MDNIRNNNSSRAKSTLFNGKVKSKLLPIYIITKDSTGTKVINRKKINFQVNYNNVYHISYKYFMPKGYHLAQGSQPRFTCKYTDNGLNIKSITFIGIKNSKESSESVANPIKVTYIDVDSNKQLEVGSAVGNYGENVDVTKQVTIPTGYKLCNGQRTNFTVSNKQQSIDLVLKKQAPVKKHVNHVSNKNVQSDKHVKTTSLNANKNKSLNNINDNIESLESSLQKYDCSLSIKLIEELLSHNLDFFKKVIAKVFSRMKYRDVDNLKANQKEQKVSGVIKKCLYNNNHVNFTFVRARKYDVKRQVTISEVRDFVTSVMDHNSSKGVFITTSHFTSDAKKEAERHSIILIDNMRLAQLMIQHNVGVKPQRIFRVVSLDKDFF